MKSFKKALSLIAALAVIMSMMAVQASAATTVFDFEDGKIPVGVEEHVTSDGSARDGDPYKMSVVDFEGSKRLKIEPQEGGTPKLKFNVSKIFGADFDKVRGIQYDLVIEGVNGEVPGWNGGTVGGSNSGPAGGWNQGEEWTLEEYDNPVSQVITVKTVIADRFKFNDEDSSLFLFMNWANNGTINYIDNVIFIGEDGNAMAIPTLASAPAADTAAKPASTPKTGETNYAPYFAVGAAVMLAGALVVIKKRKSVKA